MKGAEHRRHARTQFHGGIRIHWEDSSGLERVVDGKVLNCSKSGMGLETKEAVEVRAMVQVHVGGFRPLGLASVRYCVRKGMRFVVGLEFSPGFRWQDVPAPGGSG